MRFFYILALVLLPTSIAFGQSQFGIDWNSDDYQLLHGDFDGDGQSDAIILAKDSSRPTVFSSDIHSTPTMTQHWIHFTPESEYLVTGDFDNDKKDEILVLQRDLSGHYFELNDSLLIVEGPQKLKFSGYNQNRQIDFTHLYRGDFNGDLGG